MRFLSWILLSLFPFALTAQSAQQAENWHFANGVALRFVDDEPVLNAPSSMIAFEGACSLSDASGNLLFYTNGGGRLPGNGGPGEPDQDYGTIWNRNHEVLYDMRGEEGGGFSARQSALAFPAPGDNPDLYYLWTMEEFEFNVGGSVTGQPQGRGLSYFIIDMSLNGGLGGVALADQRVYVPAYEGLDATPMEGTDGYWIVCHNNQSGAAGLLVVVPLTEAGVGLPVEVTLPNGVGGRIKFSPDGRYLYQKGTVYAFDPVTGTVGDVLLEAPGLSDQNATFTPDSRFLYGTEAIGILSNVVVRYDVSTGAQLPVAALEEPGATAITLVNGPFQIGPGGDIYFIEAIVDPQEEIIVQLNALTCVSGSEPGLRRGVVDLAAFLDDGIFPNNPPQFVDAIFREPVLADTVMLDTAVVIICPGENGELTTRTEGTSYEWSTGDTTATITVEASGVYCVTVADGCNVFVDCQDVTFESDANDPVVLDAYVEDCRQICVVALNTESTFDSITVVTGITNPFGTDIILSTEVFYSDTVLFSKPPTDPGPDMNSYVQAVFETACGLELISLLNLPFPEPEAFTAQITFLEADFCRGEELQLEVVSFSGAVLAEVIWSDGVTDNPRSVILAVDSAYTASAISECGDTVQVSASPTVQETCNCRAEVPDVITPNGDGTNDGFGLFFTRTCTVENYTLLIFNRWGQRIFSSTDPNERWDGTVNGTPVNMDVYLYRMVFRFAGSDVVEEHNDQFSVIR